MFSVGTHRVAGRLAGEKIFIKGGFVCSLVFSLLSYRS
jgi:hypothetical protein